MLTPAVEPARPRLRFLLGFAVGASVAGVTVAVHVVDPFAEETQPAPIVSLVQTPMPAMPQPVLVPITVTTPPPPPAPVISAPEEPEPVPPRALVPMLNAECFGTGFDVEPDVACTWDDGFPAISHDAQTVVVKRSLDDAGRGHPSLYIDFVDVATSKVTRTMKILAPDEFDAENKHVPKVRRRVAAAQQAIDAIGFRSMTKLVGEGEPSTSSLRVEGENGSIRVVDRTRAVAIFQATFTGDQAFPNMKRNEEMGCDTPSAWGASTAWDEETRTIVATVHYAFGGCMCGGDSTTFVRKVR